MGMTTTEVRAALGDPDDKTELNQAGVDLGLGGPPPSDLRLETWSYHSGVKGQSMNPYVKTVQISFYQGKVTSISTF